MSQNNPFVFTAGSGQIPLAPAQQTGIPVSNMQHRNPSAPAQSVSLQQNTHLPGIDMSALEGISPEQLAAIARLFQTGALQMPPPALNIPTHNSEPTAQSASTPVLATSSTPQASQAQASTTIQEDVNMDTEEGEVDESEGGGTPAKVRDFLRPPPTGPRNRSLSPRDRVKGNPKHRSSPRPPIPSATVNKEAQSQHFRPHQASGGTTGNRTLAKDEEAKLFVLEMVKAGYSFEDIAPDIRNRNSLSRMFKDLSLPLPSSQALRPASQQGTTTASHASQIANGEHTAREDAAKASLNKPPAAAKSAPADRSTYLARLQAAKNKKPDATAPTPPEAKPEVKPTAKPEPVPRSEYLAMLQAARNKKPDIAAASSTPPEPASDPVPIDSVVTPAQGSKSVLPLGSGDTRGSTGRPSSAGRSSAMTELARQKLEALKAQQAAKQNRNLVSSPIPNPPPVMADRHGLSSPSQSGLGAGLADIPAQMAKREVEPPPALQNVPTGVHPLALEQRPVLSTPQTPSRSFSGLPGLFMFDTTAQAQVPAQTWQNLSASQRDAQSDSPFIVSQKQSDNSSSKFPSAVGTTGASPAPATMARKRPVASDFDEPSSTKRPFGQSRTASEDESLVIQVSDEEDSDDDMEAEPIPETSSLPRLQTTSFRDVGPLRDFPPKPNFQAQASGPSTPGGVTYEQKIKQIEEIKRRIAEKERRQKANGKGAVSKPEEHDSVAGPSPTLLDDSALDTPEAGTMQSIQNKPLAAETSLLDSITQSSPQTGMPIHSRSISSDRPLSATQLAKQQEKERLRQRLLELEQEASDDETGAVEAAVPATHPQHATPGALPSASSALNQNQDTATQTPVEKTAVEIDANGSASEEGELSDDSMSKFYDQQDGEDDDKQNLALDDPGEVETQAPAQVYGSSNKDNPIAGLSSSQPSMMSASEYQADVHTEDVEMNDDIHHPATTIVLDNLVTPQSLAGEDMDEDSNEDDDDQDEIPKELFYPPNATHSDGGSSPDGSSEEDSASKHSASHTSSAQLENVDAAPVPFISEAARDEHEDTLITADDLAPEIQPNHDEQAVDRERVQNPARKTYFTPYRSPLADFKDYRYHPEYLDTVATGYKSITYSHNIDPTNPLCPYETAGGKCNDTTCQNQHFKSMVVSDNELLQTLGTKHIPAHNPEELKKWNDGLGAVVRGLRNTESGKDASAIAARITEFRREFIGDPTKILNLG